MGNIGRTIVLFFLILVLAGGGVVWFDYLNVIDAKTVLAPVYEHVPFLKGKTRSKPAAGGTGSAEGSVAPLNLNDERYAVRLEALNLRNAELTKQETDIKNRQGQIEQMAQELEQRQKSLDEREKSLNAESADAETKSESFADLSRRLTGMPPQQAVGIMNAMGDQDVIGVLRKTDELAKVSGSSSLVPYWMSLMDPKRAAELSRKMIATP